MLLTTCNKDEGTSLIEVLISMAIMTIGIVGVLGVFSQSYLSSAKSDNLGRAAEILHRTLEREELRIMNESCTVTTGTTTATVYSSGQGAAQQGDRQFTVSTTIASVTTTPPTWRVTVQVTWSSNPSGIKESLIVTRQSPFKTLSTTCS